MAQVWNMSDRIKTNSITTQIWLCQSWNSFVDRKHSVRWDYRLGKSSNNGRHNFCIWIHERRRKKYQDLVDIARQHKSYISWHIWLVSKMGTNRQQNVSAMVRWRVAQSLYLRSTFGFGDRTRLRKRTTAETQTLWASWRDNFDN